MYADFLRKLFFVLAGSQSFGDRDEDRDRGAFTQLRIHGMLAWVQLLQPT
jgi:hypothetical protein